MKSLLFVDCQNDFLLEKGSLNLGHDTSELRKRLGDLAKNFEGMIYFTKDSHNTDDCEFGLFPKHCINDTWGHNIIPELAEAVKDKMHTVLVKKSFTDENIAFLADNFVEMNIEEIHVAGVCTHICVHDVVASIVNHIKSKYDITPKIVIHKDLVDDFDPEISKFALKRLQNLYGVKII